MESFPGFVEVLRRELPSWQADGIVTPEGARVLAARYGLGGAAPAPRDRSAALAVASALAVTLALAASLLLSGIGDGVLLPIAALAAAFAAMPLAVRGDGLTPATAVRTLGRFLFYAAAYALSFVQLADLARFKTGLHSEGLLSAVPPFLLGAAALRSGWRRADVDPHTRGEAMLLVATVLAFAAGLSLDTGAGTALVATMALAFLAVGRIVRGLTSLCRASFLEGLCVAAVLVASRGFDVFPSWWVPSVIAVAVLLAAVIAAIAFERRRARAAAVPAAEAGPGIAA
jgi:hypothetical protein